MAEQILRREGENILNEAGENVARFEANNIIGDFSGGGGGGDVPIATPTRAGKVKPDGTTITVTADGTISAVGGGTTRPWTNLISSPITSDANTTFELNESIDNYNELLITVGFHDEATGTGGYTHLNTQYFGKFTLDFIKDNYNNGRVGSIDVSLMGEFDTYYCTWLLNFIDHNHINIYQKLFKGYSPKTACAILSIQAR